jgi:prolyl-tRNA editing enzyme YbaK/EbsC (Cys-tRNA(Pro) deacylase)
MTVALVAETIGGVSPVGWLSKEAVVLIDTALNDYEVIWAAAGHPRMQYFPRLLINLQHSQMLDQ